MDVEYRPRHMFVLEDRLPLHGFAGDGGQMLISQLRRLDAPALQIPAEQGDRCRCADEGGSAVDRVRQMRALDDQHVDARVGERAEHPAQLRLAHRGEGELPANFLLQNRAVSPGEVAANAGDSESNGPRPSATARSTNASGSATVTPRSRSQRAQSGASSRATVRGLHTNHTWLFSKPLQDRHRREQPLLDLRSSLQLPLEHSPVEPLVAAVPRPARTASRPSTRAARGADARARRRDQLPRRVGLAMVVIAVPSPRRDRAKQLLARQRRARSRSER